MPDSNELHREAFEANAYDPDPTRCEECGCPMACCMCGHKTCEVCWSNPCDCGKDEEDGE